ncbi:hypothetical protein WA026_012403 [Henosepilachna vigintioctopunctata]|uniref:Uncharacterized protein n=1 Tax=Henosepilachna vigintioctopunctata TaxID=420089 RepID=A0AAW1UXM0_9CUCU
MICVIQKLTETHKEVTGFDIPLDELGYWDSFDSLSDLPELSIVKRSTLDSEEALFQPEGAFSQKDRRENNEGFYEAGRRRHSQLLIVI